MVITVVASLSQMYYHSQVFLACTHTTHTHTDKVLYVITGKGIHSKGEAKIKPAVIQYLRNNEYM